MSYTFIENQPIIFSKLEEPEYYPGRGEYDYAMLVSRDHDITNLQIKISPEDIALECIASPDIFDVTKWAVSGSGAKSTNLITIGDGSSGDAEPTLIQDPFALPNGRYQVTVTVQTIFGSAYITNGSGIVGTITGAGAQTLTFDFDGTVKISIADTTSYIEITNVSLKKMPEYYIIGIKDTLGNVVKVFNSDRDSSFFTIQKDRLTIQLEWAAGSPDLASLTDGCYYIAIADPEENPCSEFGLYNNLFVFGNSDEGGLSVIDGWTTTTPLLTEKYFYPGPYRAQITVPDGEERPGFRNSITQLCAGKEYEITVYATEDSLHPAHLIVSAGGDSQTIIMDGSASYTINLTPATDDYLTFSVDNSSAPGYEVIVSITQVYVTLVNDADYMLNYETPYPVKIADEWQNTFGIVVYNNEDGLGFVFEDQVFQPFTRVEGNIINRSYEIDLEQETNDIGVKANQFGEMRKNRFLRIEAQPNIIHDFLAMGIIADYFYIYSAGDTANLYRQYVVKSDSYEPDYSDNLDNMATVELEIGEPVQLVRNVNSGNLNPLV